MLFEVAGSGGSGAVDARRARSDLILSASHGTHGEPLVSYITNHSNAWNSTGDGMEMGWRQMEILQPQRQITRRDHVPPRLARRQVLDSSLMTLEAQGGALLCWMIGFSQGARRVMTAAAAAAAAAAAGTVVDAPRGKSAGLDEERRRLMLAAREGDGAQGNSSAW